MTATETAYLRRDDQVSDSVRAALFGELVKHTHGVTESYHSDLWHDARWIARYVTGPMTFWYAARDTGTSIGTDHDLVAVLVGRDDRLWRVELAHDPRSGRWAATFTEKAAATAV